MERKDQDLGLLECNNPLPCICIECLDDRRLQV